MGAQLIMAVEMKAAATADEGGPSAVVMVDVGRLMRFSGIRQTPYYIYVETIESKKLETGLGHLLCCLDSNPFCPCAKVLFLSFSEFKTNI